MPVKVAINVLGRIGRLFFRAAMNNPEIQLVGVNDVVPADNLAYLLKYDSTQGRFNRTVETRKSRPDLPDDDLLIVDGHEIKSLGLKATPDQLPWNALGVDYVIECTGLWTYAAKARGHLTAGA